MINAGNGAPIALAVVNDTETLDIVLDTFQKYPGISLEVAPDKDIAVSWLAKHPSRFDVFILDVSQFGFQGIEVCQRIRSQALAIPVILLVNQKNEIDGIIGLEAGADDYVLIPFVPRALHARIHALLRRSQILRKAPMMSAGDLVLNLPGRDVLVRGKRIDLAQVEFNILHYLFLNIGNVILRENLLKAIWPEESHVKVRLIDCYMYRLREKIEPDPRNPIYIETVRGLGYKFTGRRVES